MASIGTAVKWWAKTHFRVEFRKTLGLQFRLFVGCLFVCFRWKAIPWRNLGRDDISESELFVGYLPWYVKPGALISGKTLWFKTSSAQCS